MTYIPSNCASMYQRDNAVVTTIAFQNTWYQVVNFLVSSLNRWTFAASTLTASAGSSGEYILLYAICFEGVKDDTYEFALAINDVIKDETVQCHFSDQIGEELHTSGNACLVVTGEQTLKLMVRNITNNGNVTIKDANVVVHKV